MDIDDLWTDCMANMTPPQLCEAEDVERFVLFYDLEQTFGILEMNDMSIILDHVNFFNSWNWIDIQFFQSEL